MARTAKNKEELLEIVTEPIKENNLNEMFSHFKRNELGLFPNLPYKLKEDNSFKIDWKSLIPDKFIVANKDRLKNVDPSTINVKELKDSEQLILLNGFRYIANLRGFSSLKQNIKFASDTFVVAECEITFIPNVETGMMPLIFVGEGDAHIGNTNSFSKNYLTCIAANRAFVRCVRNALDIPVLGQDEIGSTSDNNTLENESNVDPLSPHAALINKLKEKGKTFDQLKSKLLKDGFDKDLIESWKQEINIPINHVIKILGILSK